MTEENREIVRQVYEAAARRDAETLVALYDPDVELDASVLSVEGQGGRIFRGHDGLRSLFREWHEAWGQIEYSYEELVDAGEQVISVVTRHARGRASGVEVERPFALLWTLRDGRVVRVVWYLDRTEALEAAGLSD
jgi:ketosteroid isomerase-like protein